MNELEKLYKYLDSISFVNMTEIYLATQDYFSEDGEKELSYGEINLCNAIAEKYMIHRNLDFDDNGDIIK